MRPRTQKQPQVKKELCRALDDVDVDVDVDVLSLLFIMKEIIYQYSQKPIRRLLVLHKFV